MKATPAASSTAATAGSDVAQAQDTDKQSLMRHRSSYAQQQQSLDSLVDALDQLYGTAYDVSHGLGRWGSHSSYTLNVCG
jgi:hypothetical protein